MPGLEAHTSTQTRLKQVGALNRYVTPIEICCGENNRARADEIDRSNNPSGGKTSNRGFLHGSVARSILFSFKFCKLDEATKKRAILGHFVAFLLRRAPARGGRFINSGVC